MSGSEPKVFDEAKLYDELKSINSSLASLGTKTTLMMRFGGVLFTGIYGFAVWTALQIFSLDIDPEKIDALRADIAKIESFSNDVAKIESFSGEIEALQVQIASLNENLQKKTP